MWKLSMPWAIKHPYTKDADCALVPSCKVLCFSPKDRISINQNWFEICTYWLIHLFAQSNFHTEVSFSQLFLLKDAPFILNHDTPYQLWNVSLRLPHISQYFVAYRQTCFKHTAKISNKQAFTKISEVNEMHCFHFNWMSKWIRILYYILFCIYFTQHRNFMKFTY